MSLLREQRRPSSLSARRYYVYVYWVNQVPIYVGKGSNGRALEFRRGRGRLGRLLKQLAQSDSELVVEYRQSSLTENQAFDLEIALIAQYGRLGIDPAGTLHNLTPGGDNPPCHKGRKFPNRRPPSSKGKPGRKWSAADKAQHCERMKLRMSDPETRRRCSIAKAGSQPPQLRTPEALAKRAATLRGRPQPQLLTRDVFERRGKAHAKLRWFNDGTTERRLLEPPVGWYSGRVGPREKFAPTRSLV